MAVGAAAPEVGDPAAAALVGGAGGEAPLLAATKEDPPPAVGVPAVEVEGKGAAVAPSEGAPAAIAVEGEEEEAHKAEDKSEAEAADGVPAVEVEGKGAAAPLEGAPAVITVEWEEETHKAEEKSEAEDEAVAVAAAAKAEEEGDEGEKWLGHCPQSPLKGIGRRRKRTRKTRRRRMRRRGDEDDDEEGENRLGQYSSTQSILIVGDGDLSFSLALATAFGSGANLVTTSLDTYEALRGKYSKAESNIMELKRLGSMVLHGVDAKNMRFHTDLKNSRFDRIVFNFPHAGFKGKEDDMHMINLHKELLWGFFFNARHLVRRYGEIHVTHKTGLPYDRWDLEHLASGSSLAMVEKVPFRKEDYPGYNQKRGDSARCDEPFDLGACCTFKFQIRDLKKLKKMNGKRASLGGSNIHPGNWVTDRGPFHHLPPFESWPWQHFPPPDNTGRMLMPLPPYIADQRPQPCFPPNSDGMVRAPYFHQHGSFHPMTSIPGPWLNTLPDQGGIHQQDNFHPMASMPGPWLNAVPDQGGIYQQDSFHPMVSMPGPWLNALPDQGGIDQQDSFHPMASMPGPWLNALPPPGGIPPPMGRTPCPDLAPQGHHWYQQRTVPDQLGGSERSLQRVHEMQRQVMPGGTSLNHPAFLEHRRRDR